MKAIINTKVLKEILSSQDKNWQERIYDETGVLLLFLKSSPILFSNCGYIDLDIDAEYRYSNTKDQTEYCVISSIEEMTDYILKMPSYKEFLMDCSLGNFSKSELFWGIYSRIISAPQNLALSKNPGDIVYGLYSIGEYEGKIDLYMAAVEYNAMSIWLPIDPNLSLNDVLDILVKELNEISEDLGEPLYDNHIENEVSVPSSYSDLLRVLAPKAEFGWLCSTEEGQV